MSRRLGLSDSLSDLSEGLPSLRQPGARCDLASSAPSSVESCAELEALLAKQHRLLVAKGLLDPSLLASDAAWTTSASSDLS